MLVSNSSFVMDLGFGISHELADELIAANFLPVFVTREPRPVIGSRGAGRIGMIKSLDLIVDLLK